MKKGKPIWAAVDSLAKRLQRLRVDRFLGGWDSEKPLHDRTMCRLAQILREWQPI